MKYRDYLIPVLFIVSLGLGIIVGENMESNYRFEDVSVSKEPANCSGNCGIHEPRYGVGWIQVRGEDVYAVNKANSSGWADYYGVPPFWVEINEEGLRDEPFDPENEEPIRVLVLGTSTTLGYGVNRTDTFSNRVERRLDSRYDREVQVLNAGSNGYGMKDYYKYLKYRGADFNPDIVVIAFKRIDWYSRRYVDRLNEKAAEQIREEHNGSLTDSEYNKKFKTRVGELIKKKWRQTPVNETDLAYMSEVEAVANKNNISTVYYSIDTIRKEEKKEYIESWAERNNKKIYYSPKDYRNNFGERVRVSEYDSHPSEIGHRIIADGLYPVLKDKIEEGRGDNK